jgi:hypothetical protein
MMSRWGGKVGEVEEAFLGGMGITGCCFSGLLAYRSGCIYMDQAR